MALDLHLGKGRLIFPALIVLGCLGQKADGLDKNAPDHQHEGRNQHRRQTGQQHAYAYQEALLVGHCLVHLQLHHHIGGHSASRLVDRSGGQHPPAQGLVPPQDRLQLSVLQQRLQGGRFQPLWIPKVTRRQQMLLPPVTGAQQDLQPILQGMDRGGKGHAVLVCRRRQGLLESTAACHVLRLRLIGQLLGQRVQLLLHLLPIQRPGIPQIGAVAHGQGGSAEDQAHDQYHEQQLSSQCKACIPFQGRSTSFLPLQTGRQVTRPAGLRTPADLPGPRRSHFSSARPPPPAATGTCRWAGPPGPPGRRRRGRCF